MHFQFATSIIAACSVQAFAHDDPAAIASAAFDPSSRTEDLAAPTNGKTNNKKHRMLQKFKKRKQRALKEAGEQPKADVGALSGNSVTPRFMQEDDYEYYCPRDSCPAELCDCAEAGNSLEDCTGELQSVCRAGKLGDCVFEDYVKVYEEVYCPFVSCVGEGFRESQCDCAFYDLYCARLVGTECKDVLNVESDDPDKKPFFGCDETELASVCNEAKSCKDKGELQGLPELGTWAGSVTTGIRNTGEKSGGGSTVVGVTLLSMIWLMMNA